MIHSILIVRQFPLVLSVLILVFSIKSTPVLLFFHFNSFQWSIHSILSLTLLVLYLEEYLIVLKTNSFNFSL